jgi:enterochelin esterase-like enzyme
MNLKRKAFLLAFSSLFISCMCSTPLTITTFADTNATEINLKDAGQKLQFTESKVQAISDYEVPHDFDINKLNVKYGNLKEVSYYSKTTGATRNCYVLLPKNYSDDKKYPVLYLLHGIGGTDSEWLSANPTAIIGNLVDEGKASDMIVVMPNIRAAANDSVPQNILSQENIKAFDNFINDLNNDLMPFINTNYSVKQGRENTAIAGLSMGGRESLFIGFKELDKFGYIGAFSPAPGLLPDNKLNYSGQLTDAQFTIPQNSVNIPKLIMICSGNNDSVVWNTPNIYHETLIANKVNHIWYTIDGNHDFTVWKHGLYNFSKRIFK